MYHIANDDNNKPTLYMEDDAYAQLVEIHEHVELFMKDELGILPVERYESILYDIMTDLFRVLQLHFSKVFVDSSLNIGYVRLPTYDVDLITTHLYNDYNMLYDECDIIAIGAKIHQFAQVSILKMNFGILSEFVKYATKYEIAQKLNHVSTNIKCLDKIEHKLTIYVYMYIIINL